MSTKCIQYSICFGRKINTLTITAYRMALRSSKFRHHP